MSDQTGNQNNAKAAEEILSALNDPKKVRTLLSDAIKRNEKRFIGIGIVMIVFGLIGLYNSIITTQVSMIVMGIFMVTVGLFFFVEAYSAPEWKGKLMSTLIALLYVAGGVMVTKAPAESAVWFTLFLASWFFVIGIMRIVLGFQAKEELQGWGWVAFSGAMSIVMAALIYTGWPESGKWVIGMLVSIEFIMQGVSIIYLSKVAKEGGKELAQALKAA